MTVTVAELRKLAAAKAVVAVSPHDMWPNGRWSGEAARTVTGWAQREAVPARVEELVKRTDEHTGKKRTLAKVTFLPHARTHGLFLPRAILGLWDDVQARRDAERNAAPRARRCAAVATQLGADVYPAALEANHHVVVLALEGAERIAWAIEEIRKAAHVGDLPAVLRLTDEIIHPENPRPVLPS